jgi:chemotaxis methyl-accepting protein methylase
MHRLPVSSTILEHELSELRLLVERQAGVLLQNSNETLIPILTAHLESRQFSSASEFLDCLRKSDSEVEQLVESLLDGSSGFGKHPGALSTFRQIVLPELRQRKANKCPKTLRVWSAGCANGEEAYEIAISICEAINGDAGWSVHVVGSDIRRSALQVAERGLYPQQDLAQMPRELLQTYFSRVGSHLLVKSRLRNLVAFTSMNLAQPSYLGRYDCIFCMDVLPQFSMAQRIALAQRMQLYLEPGGYLLLGDREKLPAADVNLESCANSEHIFYRKPMAAAAGL